MQLRHCEIFFLNNVRLEKDNPPWSLLWIPSMSTEFKNRLPTIHVSMKAWALYLAV